MDNASLEVSSPDLAPGARFALRNTGRGQDLSPQLDLRGLSPKARTLAVSLDDRAFPIPGGYNHWIIWNLPAQDTVPAAIPAGATLPSGAHQGIGYGRHQYAGPKPPLHGHHTYRFTVYVLDTELDLPENAHKKDFLKAARDHVLQTASLEGVFE